MANLFRGVQHAKVYQKFRPEYPSALYGAIFKFLFPAGNDGIQEHSKRLAQTSDVSTALDIGCGTGISTIPLCGHFKRVIGIDVSESQLDEARKASAAYKNVTYRVGLAHELTFQDNQSVDLITVAQAMHWLDTKKFYAECNRLLRPGGVLAVYGYGVPSLKNAEANAVVKQFHDVTLGEFWEEGRKHIVDCYKELYKDFEVEFPVSERVDQLVLEKSYGLDDFIGYLESWSAYQICRSRNKDAVDPLIDVSVRLKQIVSETAKSKKSHDKCAESSLERGDNSLDEKKSAAHASASETQLLATSPIFILLGRKTTS